MSDTGRNCHQNAGAGRIMVLVCWGAWVSALILLASLSGCERRADEPEVIRIGVLADFGSSRDIADAARLMVSSINEAGGLDVGGHRRQVELLVEDTEAKPNEAVDSARRLIRGNVAAIVGPGRSRDAMAVAGLLENARIPMISPTSTHPETTVGRRYVFRMSFTDTFQGKALGRFAFEELGASSAAVLYDVASAYNRHLATVFQQAFEAAGGTMAAVETYTTGDSDYRHQLRRIRDAEPQLLFLPNYFEEIPAQARQARELGIEATLLGGDSWTRLPADGLSEFEGAFFGQHWHAVGGTEADLQARRLGEEFREAYGRDLSSEVALTYDALGLIFGAIASAGADPEGIRQILAETEGYQGMTGVITYRGNNGDPPKPLVIMHVRQGVADLYSEVEP